MKVTLAVVKSLEDSGVLLKGVSETIKNEGKNQKGGFLSMLLGKLRKYASRQGGYKSRRRNN